MLPAWLIYILWSWVLLWFRFNTCVSLFLLLSWMELSSMCTCFCPHCWTHRPTYVNCICICILTCPICYSFNQCSHACTYMYCCPFIPAVCTHIYEVFLILYACQHTLCQIFDCAYTYITMYLNINMLLAMDCDAIHIYVQVCITALTDILCLTDMPLFNWYTSLSEYICAYKHMHISIHWYTLVSIYISLFPTALICFAYDFIYVMANLICFDNLDFRTGISACRITSLFHKREETGESFSTLRPSLVCGNGIGIRPRNWNWTLQFQFFLLVSALEMEFEFWTQFHEIGF